MATPGELQRARVQARLAHALEGDSRALYRKELKAYEAYCIGCEVPAYPVDAFKLGDYLHSRCEALNPPNTASWATWQSQVTRGAELLKGLEPLSEAQKSKLHDMQTAARSLLGYTSVAPPEASCAKLNTMWRALNPDPAKNLLEWTIMVISIVAYAFTLRPGEFADGAKNKKKVVAKLRHLKLFDAEPGKEHGSMTLLLEWDKAARRSKKRSDSTLMVYGCGGDMCPVALMRKYLQVHNLGPGHADEPIFTEMLWNGKRASPPRVLQQASYNNAIAVLCARAAVPRHTGRATRSGRRNDLAAGGASSPVRQALGRWQSERAEQAYARNRPQGPLTQDQHPPLALGML